MAPDIFAQSSLSILRPASINVLSVRLNRRKLFTTRDGKLRDYRGLMIMAGLTSMETEEVEQAHDKVSKIIFLWCRHSTSPSVANLIDALTELDRHDVVEDAHPKLIADCTAAHEVGINTVALGAQHTQASQALTVDDLAANSRGKRLPMYDAMILHESLDPDDDAFAYRLVEERMRPAGLKVFLPSEDVLAGSIYHAEAVSVIQNRVKHVFIICSDSFFEDKTKVNRYLYNNIEIKSMKRSRFIVPVYYKRCSNPWQQIT